MYLTVAHILYSMHILCLDIHQLTARNFANMLNNSTQRLAAVATSISPLSDPRDNQFFCIHLCVLDVILGLVQLFELGTEN